jgi:hypothetical protein
VINLKSKLLVAMTMVLIASIILSSYAAYASAAPKTEKNNPPEKQYNSFTLTAEGTAINAAGETVDVSFAIQGNADGKLKTVFQLRTQGGDATVTNFDAISATKGQGVIVNKDNFIHLNVMMSAQYYGGRSTVWILRGTTGTLANDDTMPVSLEAPNVVLPLKGYPQLTDLTLDGSIKFS